MSVLAPRACGRHTLSQAADINASGDVNLADGVYELQWEFIGGPEPPPPFPTCGPHRVPLGCERPTCPQLVF